MIVPGQSAPAAGSAVAGLPLPKIADHDLLHVIGRGAYGEVWLARHLKLGALRAVKIVRRDQFGDVRPFTREFEGIQKYEPISRSHPNLVSILHVGGTDDCFYYVMELADTAENPNAECRNPREIRNPNTEPAAQDANLRTSGFELGSSFVIRHSSLYSPHTLRSELKQHGALPINRCLEIGRALASALAHLHAHKLVHRDVKPSNVIFVGGVAKLADIGLVAGVDDARSFVGTEGYVPFHGAGTPSADCYSLGKLLYELSTGHDRTAWPEPPADLATHADRERLLEVNAILHRACAPDPRQRYADGVAMLAELELLQHGESVRCKRAVEWRLAAAAKLALISGLIGLIAVLGFLLSRVVKERQPGSTRATPQPEMKGTKNREAWNAYVEGQHYYTRVTPDGARRAIKSMKEAIRLDPKFAQAWAALAEIYHWWDDLFPSSEEALAKGREAALQALALDDSLANAHIEVAFGDWHLDRNFSKAEQGLKRAIQLSPDLGRAHGMYGWLLLEMGRLDEAKEQQRLAQLFDPVEPRHCCGAACVFLSAGQTEQAVGQLRRALDLDPNFFWAYALLAEIHEEKGEFSEAIEMSRKAALGYGMQHEKAVQQSDDLRRAFSTGGARGYWQKKLEFSNVSSNFGADPYDIAVIYLHLGQKDLALEFLGKAEARRGADQAFRINFDRRFDSVRSDPRFLALLRKLGLEK